MNWPWRMTALVGVLAAGWLSACDETGPVDGGLVPPDPTCIDRDGDGYGVNCSRGLDCDDDDATINETCPGYDRCSTPARGCPCSSEGEVVVCRTREPQVSPDGSILCYAGERTCVDGTWGSCEGMEPYPPAGETTEGGDDDGVHREAVLGFPRECTTATCDPTCMEIHDCPAGRDLTPANSSNLMYDPVNLTPPAIILEDLDIDGFFYRAMEADCGGAYNETFSWWSLSWDLSNYAAPRGFRIRVRVAPTEAGLAAAPWWVLVNCPGGPCVNPAHPDDKAFNDGILYDLLLANGGHEATRYPWLEYEVRMWSDGVASSPQLTSIDWYFMCEEAT